MTPFAMHLAGIRRRLGITQAEMAMRLGIAAAYLSAVENGAKPVSDALLIRLEAKFATTMRERAQLRDAAKVSVLQRKMPQSADTKAYLYVADLWSCMGQLKEEDWMALHAVLDVVHGNRHRKTDEEHMNTE